MEAQMFLSELFCKFEAARAVDHTKSTIECYELAVKHWLDIVGDKEVYTEEDVDRFKWALLRQKKSRTSINIWLRAVLSIQNFGLQRGYWTKRFVTLKNQLKQDVLPPAFLKPAEFQTLLSVVRSHRMRVLLTLLVMTGARVSEALRMEWSDIEGDIWTIRRTKSHRFRSVPLHPKVLELLSTLPRDSRPFPYVRCSVAQAVRKARIKTGLSRAIHCHTLRHTTASWMVQNGVPILTVGKVLGHASPSMTMKYAHLDVESQRQAVAMLPMGIAGIGTIPLLPES
jgi:integrase